jgi:hypothetical protein
MKYAKEEAVEVVRFLRYRLDDPAMAKRTYMGTKAIGKFINRSESYVKLICE